MTREEFIAKIENPNDVERVIARVDEGAQLMKYTDAAKLAEWYDFCAKLYDQSILPSTLEGVSDKVTGEKHNVIVEEFSFLHFNAMISEGLDRYRHLMHTVELEDRITDEVGASKMSLKKIVDAYNAFTDIDGFAKVVENSVISSNRALISIQSYVINSDNIKQYDYNESINEWLNQSIITHSQVNQFLNIIE